MISRFALRSGTLQDIACLEARVRIDRRIEQRRLVSVLDNHLLARDENGARNTEARIETDRVLDTDGGLREQFAP